MVLTDLSIRNPAGVVVAVLLACFLGIYAFVKLPVQLFPDVEEPALTIATQWRAAAPSEVEAQIVEPQEQALRGTPGLKELNAFANAGNAWLTLRFAPGTDELYPPWQGMQYLRDMLGGRAKLEPLDNDRYPETEWTTVAEFLADLIARRRVDATGGSQRQASRRSSRP